MLNEMLSYMWKCPVCGRYHNGPLERWWCPYCGPTLNTVSIEKIKDIINRLDIVEDQIAHELPVESIPIPTIDELLDDDDD